MRVVRSSIRSNLIEAWVALALQFGIIFGSCADGVTIFRPFDGWIETTMKMIAYSAPGLFAVWRSAVELRNAVHWQWLAIALTGLMAVAWVCGSILAKNM